MRNWIQRQAGRYFAHGCLSGKKIIGGRRQDKIFTHIRRQDGLGAAKCWSSSATSKLWELAVSIRCLHYRARPDAGTFSQRARSFGFPGLINSNQSAGSSWKDLRVEIKINIKIFKQVCVTVKENWDAIKSILKVFSVEFSWNSILFSYLHIQRWKCGGDVLSIWDPLWLQIEGSAVCPTITSLKLTQGQVWPLVFFYPSFLLSLACGWREGPWGPRTSFGM